VAYQYIIIAIDSATGLSASSDAVQATRPGYDALEDFTAEVDGTGESADLSWSAASSPAIVSYRIIIARLTGDPPATVIETINLTIGTTAYVASLSPSGRLTTFSLYGVDSAGNLSQAATATATAAIDIQADWYVATTGNDNNPGTSGQPFATIGKAATVATAGHTVLIRNGYYPEAVRHTRSGTIDKPIRFVAETTHGAIISGGTSIRSFGWDTGKVRFVHLVGVVVEECFSGFGKENAAIRCGRGCDLTDVISRDHVGFGIGVLSGAHGVTWTRVDILRCGLAAFNVARCTDFAWLGGLCQDNNRGHALNVPRFHASARVTATGKLDSPQYILIEGGIACLRIGNEVNKLARTLRVRIVGVTFRRTRGYNLWFDIDNREFIVRDCIFDNALPVKAINTGQQYQPTQLALEICPGPGVVEDCTFRNSRRHDGSRSVGLSIEETRNIIARRNRFETDAMGFRNIPHSYTDLSGVFYQMQCSDIVFTGNTLVNSAIWANVESARFSSAQRVAQNIVIADNQWVDRYLIIWGRDRYTTAAAGLAAGMS